MTTINAVVEAVIAEQGEVIIDDEGFKLCPVCGERKQEDMPTLAWTEERGWIYRTKRVYCPCSCDAKREELRAAAREQKQREQEERRRARCFKDAGSVLWTFEVDDRRNKAVSKTCRSYADHMEEMMAENIGLLLYGPKGTGKSFYAACIANTALAHRKSAKYTNTPTIVARLSGFDYAAHEDYIDNLARVDLLVIDDVGAERTSDYVLERVKMVLDARIKAQRPIIATTNLSPTDMMQTDEVGLSRIYDRILGACSIKIRVDGESRRLDEARHKSDVARRIMGQ